MSTEPIDSLMVAGVIVFIVAIVALVIHDAWVRR